MAGADRPLNEAVEALLAWRGTPAAVEPPGAAGQRWSAPRLLGGVVLGEPPGPAPEVRAFLRDGFRHTPFRLRRPAQWTVGTALAAAPFWRPPLAEPAFSLRPGLDGAERLLWLPLRRKVRLFDFAAGQCLVVLRPEAEAEGLRREVALRAGGEGPWPPLIEAEPEAGRYREPLLRGFVLSRAPASAPVGALLRRALGELERWSAPGEREADAEAYVRGLLEEIEAMAARVGPAVNAEAASRLQSIAMRLLPAATRGPLRLAPAHGDLQLGNVLCERGGRRLWLLDWEHHGERQLGHDRLVLGLASRSGGRFGSRLLAFLAGSRRFPLEPFDPGWAARQAVAARFLLEELHFHLRESLVGGRPLPSAGLLRYLARAPRWAALLGRAG